MKLDADKAVVVLSGGQDSTTCLGWALQRFGTVECITFDYGQRHDREVQAAIAVVGYFERKTGRTIPHELLYLSGGALCSTSPLVDHGAELETYESHQQMEGVIGDRVEKTFVPMRNALFLTIAANRAAAAGARYVVTGVCEADNANYPDCRLKFVQATEAMVSLALGVQSGEFLIATPLMSRSKAQTVHMAVGLPPTYGALAFSHTAYDGEFPPVGRDHASVLRAHGFEVAGLPDPLVLRAYQLGLMTLPDTPNYAPDLVEKVVQEHYRDWDA